jgi:dephospho-CoA kinase
MKVIGITGSSGSGKSTVCQKLAKLRKSVIIDADQIARELQHEKTEYYEKIVENFGQDILLEDKSINRKTLADIIFSNMDMKIKLDELTFKYVVDEIKRQIEMYSKQNLEYILVDAPTLIEANMKNMFDYIIVVIASKENQIDRICKRDGITEMLAVKRLDSQHENDFYTQYADFVISNDDEKIDIKVKAIVEKMEEKV